jgi:hypothetical protein
MRCIVICIVVFCLWQVDLEAACAHHRNSFSNPAEFTIVLTGNTSLEAVMPLLTRYLATIPAAEGRGGRLDPRNLKPLPFRFPETPVVEDVEVRPGGYEACTLLGVQPYLLCLCV